MNKRQPKEDAHQLVNEFIGRAEKMLAEYGEFYPFGGSMKPDGEIVWEAASDGTEYPRSQPLIEILRQAHQEARSEG
jgi:hypothetical protein